MARDLRAVAGVRLAPCARATAALLPAVLVLACSGSPEAPPGPTARVERGRMERIVVATGTLEPEKEVEVKPRISGIVERVLVAAGDVVAAGQTLVEIERELLAAQVDEARARLAGAAVEVRYATTDLERATALRREGTMAAREYDEARARWERAAAEVDADRAALEALEVQLRYTTVTAPMAGTVLDVDVKEGSAVSGVTTVTGGSRLLTLASTGPLHLEGLVDENEVAHVAVGQPARLRTEAYSDRVFAGRVRKIAPLGQRQQNVTYFEVEVLAVDDDEGLLRPRMSADADIVTAVIEDAVSLPETALRYEGSDVYAETPGAAGAPPVRHRLRLGIVDGDRVQVLDGLDAGDEVTLR